SCSLFFVFFFDAFLDHRVLHSFPTRRSSDLALGVPRPWPPAFSGLRSPPRVLRPVPSPPRLPQGTFSPRTRGPSPGPPRPSESEDRKSTRLNSSHVAISYAVFCLKKKKNNTV